jgi:site-specific DNA-adenine methylase
VPFDHTKAPFPWFGGKSKAAPLVWELLGDVPHYVEPFAGSLAVLLNRPHQANRSYFSETVNDLDGVIVNAWRAIQWHPDEVAEHVSWPVTEADKTARQIAVQRWRTERNLDLLAGSPKWCDPEIAGWWIWGVCVQIGAIGGPWTADPDTGRIIKQGRAGLREAGVYRDLPHLKSDGQGVNSPQLREAGVSRDRPHLGDDGQGVNSPQLREATVGDGAEFHPLVMPRLREWMHLLSARLRHVRIVNGDWTRVVTHGAAQTLAVRMSDQPAGIFLDPPYDNTERSAGIYHGDMDNGDVAAACRQWALTVADNPKWRIVIAGYDTEHQELEQHGWTVHEWFAKGFLSGGMGNIDGTSQQHRERLWASPHCLTAGREPAQGSLW